MQIADIARVAGLPDIRRLIGLPDFPAVATAATIAAKLRGLSEVDERAPAGERLSMLALGLFVFGLDTLAYQELQRRSEWRHPSAERFGTGPAAQFTGPGADAITLPGLLLPELAGALASIARLREMADAGDAYPLVESAGTILGDFVIRGIEETRSTFLPGGAPRRVDFVIELERVYA